MIAALFSKYSKMAWVMGLLILIVLLEMLGFRATVYDSIFPFFHWMQTSFWFGIIGTSYGGVYATVEAIHLMSMAVLCGSILIVDLRLLGVIFRDIPSELIVNGTWKWIKISWAVVILTGIFCGSGVSEKIYEKNVFWIKMLALLAGTLFMIYLKQPLLTRRPHNEISPRVIKSVALASICVWVTVAATGRWIGFT